MLPFFVFYAWYPARHAIALAAAGKLLVMSYELCIGYIDKLGKKAKLK